jgi:hypothetical protein
MTIPVVPCPTWGLREDWGTDHLAPSREPSIPLSLDPEPVQVGDRDDRRPRRGDAGLGDQGMD